MKSLLFLSILFFSLQSYAQRTIFTQYMQNPYRFNPAYAGVKGTNITESISRLNLDDLFGNTQTSMLSYNTSLDKINSGIGISILYDVNNNNLFHYFENKISYNYNIKLGETHSIRLGTSIGTEQGWLNSSGLTFGSQFNGLTIDTSQPSGEEFKVKTSLITDLGFNYSYKNFQLMGAVNILYTSNNTAKTYKIYYGLIAYDIKLRDDIKLTPSIFYTKQGQYSSTTDINLNFYYKKLITGFTYRTNATIAFMTGFKFANRFQIVGSWERWYSKIFQYTTNGFEISLIYQPKQEKN